MAGSLILLDSVTASDDATVTLGTTDWDNSYNVYMVTLVSVTPATDEAYLQMRFTKTTDNSVDSSSNYDRATMEFKQSAFGDSYQTDQAQFNFYRLIYAENKLSVFNPFYADIKNLTISYSGSLVVTKVIVTTSHGNKFIGSINNNIEQDLINKQKTNPEDDTLILHDEGDTLQKSIKKTPYRSGIARPTINANYFNEKGKLQKVERPTAASTKSSMQDYTSPAKPGSPQQKAGVRVAKKPTRKIVPKRVAPKIAKKKGSY